MRDGRDSCTIETTVSEDQLEARPADSAFLGLRHFYSGGSLTGGQYAALKLRKLS
jgi:hypothetical protein